VFVQVDITATKSISGDRNTEGVGTLATDIPVAVLLVECSQIINDLTDIRMFPSVAIANNYFHFPVWQTFSFQTRTASLLIMSGSDDTEVL